MGTYLNTTTTITTTATASNIIDNVNQSNNSNNEHFLLYSTTSSSSSSDLSSLPPYTSQINSTAVMLKDVVASTAAVVVDFATEWLTTTVARTAANLSNISNGTTASFPSPLVSSNAILNYFNTSAARDNDNDTSSRSGYVTFNNATDTTFILNADLIGEQPKLSDDGSYYDDDLHDCHPENEYFNCSRNDYILFILGPQTLPLYRSLMITIIYGVIFITALLGNVLVCVVIVRQSSLHIATNYYLFSLAVSDLIYLIFGLPTEVFLHWHQYPYLFGLPFCKVRAFISEASTYVSVLTIVAFSAERYLAICKPFFLFVMSGFKRAVRIIASLWLVSFLGAIPFAIYTKINYLYYPPDQSRLAESGFCGFDTPKDIPLFEVSSFLSFFLPMICIFFFYGCMCVTICSKTKLQLGVQRSSMHRKSKQSRKTVIMLGAVVLTFFICWLPFHIQRLWYVHGTTYKYYQEVNEWLFSMAGFTYYVSCTINPILYNVMSNRYRKAFKDILCCKHDNNGFARDQSSFREPTLASSLYNTSTYDRVHSIRARSFNRHSYADNYRNRSSIKSNNTIWKKLDFNTPISTDMPGSNLTNLSSTNAIVVCVDNGVNGRTKIFTENEAQETLLNKNHETCI